MVLLAHGHPAVRGWIRDALSQVQDIEFVAEASDDTEMWRLILQVRWDVALISRSLWDTGPAEATELAWAAVEGVRVVVIGVPDHDSLLCRLWRAGALGCVPEEAAPEAIAEAVRAAARGQSLWTAEQLAQAQCWWDEVGSRLEALTERERQVLGLVADGLSDRQIARRLRIGARTAQTHVSNILGKLGLETRQQAIVFVLKRASGDLSKLASL